MTSETDQNCFVNRVQEIPMVSATVSHALNVYEKTKNYNRLMNATLMLAENSVKYALEKAQPVRKILNGPSKKKKMTVFNFPQIIYFLHTWSFISNFFIFVFCFLL